MKLPPQSAPAVRPGAGEREETNWTRRRDAALTILLWLTLLGIGAWLLAQVAHAALILAVSILLAYALIPPVQILARTMPRWLAIVVVYVAVLAALGALGYTLLATALSQFSSLARTAGALLVAPTSGATSPLIQELERLGVSQSQIASAQQQVISQIAAISSGAVPVLGAVVNGTVSAALDTILVIVLSLYFMVDGPRTVRWLRTSAPRRWRPTVSFLVNTLGRVIGGYVRGQLVMSTLMGLVVGLGMAALQVPYAVLLGMLAFVTEFIPVLGSLAAGAVCTLVALTQGWALALIVLAYFVVVHLLDGYVVSPRVVGRAVGLHPIVAITALVAGGDLFGIPGALFAAPVAGLLQALILAFWIEWRGTHPSEFGAKGGNADAEPVDVDEEPSLPERETPVGARSGV